MPGRSGWPRAEPLRVLNWNPIKRGIPAAVVLSPGNQVLYTSRMGELSSARRMSEPGVYDFFSQVVASSKAKK